MDVDDSFQEELQACLGLLYKSQIYDTYESYSSHVNLQNSSKRIVFNLKNTQVKNAPKINRIFYGTTDMSVLTQRPKAAWQLQEHLTSKTIVGKVYEEMFVRTPSTNFL